jgi:rfaE bifunctional protein kinase chain/domain
MKKSPKHVSSSRKILFFEDLVRQVKMLQAAGKRVVQSHGIFDVIHPGISQHLSEAKTQGDILVVSVIRDKDVRRGPGLPIFSEQLRAETVATLEQVDFVAIVDDEIPFDCVKKLAPNVFAKGKTLADQDGNLEKRISAKEKELGSRQSKVFETSGLGINSEALVNRFLDVYSDETKAFLKGFNHHYSFGELKKQIDSLKNMRVLLIGDSIIDEYHFCTPMGRSLKTALVVHNSLTEEVFIGGSLIIANHLAGICGKVQLVTLLGRENSRESFIQSNLRENVQSKFFFREDGPTICKKRYINLQNQKLFEINFLNDSLLNRKCENQILSYLAREIPQHDLVLVSDFGHGIITKKIMKFIQETSSIYAVNTQTNAANWGYNLITKYHKPNFVCLDEVEARLATQDKHSNIEIVAKKILSKIEAEHIIVTLGKKGSIAVNQRGMINKTPIFSTKVVDTIGAGDAFFAFTAPCFARGFPLDLVSFIGNAVGALAVQIVGNKKPVEKFELLELIKTLLK